MVSYPNVQKLYLGFETRMPLHSHCVACQFQQQEINFNPKCTTESIRHGIWSNTFVNRSVSSGCFAPDFLLMQYVLGKSIPVCFFFRLLGETFVMQIGQLFPSRPFLALPAFCGPVKPVWPASAMANPPLSLESLRSLPEIFRILVVCGATGSGKSRIIEKLVGLPK